MNKSFLVTKSLYYESKAMSEDLYVTADFILTLWVKVKMFSFIKNASSPCCGVYFIPLKSCTLFFTFLVWVLCHSVLKIMTTTINDPNGTLNYNCPWNRIIIHSRIFRVTISWPSEDMTWGAFGLRRLFLEKVQGSKQDLFLLISFFWSDLAVTAIATSEPHTMWDWRSPGHGSPQKGRRAGDFGCASSL